MLYFFHHFELPVIMQQARIQQIIIETRSNANRDTNDLNQTNNVTPETPTNIVEELQQPPPPQETINNVTGLETNNNVVNSVVNSVNNENVNSQ